MSKLFELLTEIAKRDPNTDRYCLAWLSVNKIGGTTVSGSDMEAIARANDEAELIAKLSDYLVKEKNQ
jgi:hypothetical protein